MSRSEAWKERSEGENEEGAREPRDLERPLQTAILEQRILHSNHPGPMRLMGGHVLGPLLSGASGIKAVAHTCATSRAEVSSAEYRARDARAADRGRPAQPARRP